jgi:chromate reductase, NAD(P)H dehydrogenase (quinone)
MAGLRLHHVRGRAQAVEALGVSTAVKVLAISGSLRGRSSNTEVLKAAAMLAPPSMTFTFYDGLGELPHFNPDLDGIGAILPPTVQALRLAVESADALLISSPEYAHGVPGSLKNALDWLVSGHEMPRKPIGLLTASRYSTHAPAALAETLRTMSTRLVDGACVVVPMDGRRLDAAGVVADAELTEVLREALRALAAGVDEAKAGGTT